MLRSYIDAALNSSGNPSLPREELEMNSRSCTVSISACVATLVMTTACNGSQWRAEDHHIHSHHSLGDGTYSIEFNARQATSP